LIISKKVLLIFEIVVKIQTDFHVQELLVLPIPKCKVLRFLWKSKNITTSFSYPKKNKIVKENIEKEVPVMAIL
jgi:hypothetical protein